MPVSNASEAKPDKPEQDQDSDTSNGIPIEDVYSAIKESAKKMGKGLAINYKEHAKSIKTAIDDQNISSREQIAYIIATAVWESGGFTSLREKYDSGWSAEEYFEQSYGPNPTKLLKRDSNRINKGETAEQILKIRKKRNIEKLGNVSPGDGSKYRGRGYIHITGKRNYSEAQKNIVGPSKLLVEGNKPDIISDPELAATNRHIAALLLVKGMKMGIYRS
ncbi:hypothetical protein [Deinococcus sp. 23YEL01]|uniref:hypothetical protein n=1 Tax=Deinococcus sp. 23YEL01 TaxID=2745871 RepID=UPI001E2DE357|nr:hypothetical protein [Deinococcus sp. 23YEL01]MCD0170073.1 hypothetical protein [Deinococcus sp. 23YEL01]